MTRVRRHGAAHERRAALLSWVHEQLRNGTLSPGDTVPTVRDLGEKFDLSRNSVQATLADLVDQGVLVTVARSGMSVAEDATLPGGDCFVLAARPVSPGRGHLADVQRGFERQISRRGGYTWLWLEDDPPVPHRQVAGVFRFVTPVPITEVVAEPDLPVVTYSGRSDDNQDGVDLANRQGGRIAAEHLLERGFQRIAFLARHVDVEDDPQHWASARELGWRETVSAAGQQPVVYRPDRADVVGAPSHEQHLRAIAAAATRAVSSHRDFDACVGVDDWAISGFLQQWREAGLPPDEVPALVGFEDLPEARGRFVTSIRPPWERLGEVAADLLWQRAVGQVIGPPVRRMVAMDISARPSTQPGRSTAMLYDTGSRADP